MDNTQNIISFCTGYGGIELGLRRAGVDLRVVCNVEIEAFVQANLVAKIEEGRMDNAPIYSDLKTFPASIFRGKICGLIGGYPCQPFSSAGKRKGEEDPRHLWPYIRKHIRAIRPVWCFFENVRGHTTMGLWRVLSDLEEDGYRTEYGLFSAEETGAPHQRIRCFILAKLPDTRSPYSREVQLAEGRTEEDAKEQESDCNGDQRGVGQLGNPASLRPRGGSENCEGEQSEVLGERLESDELANTEGNDEQGRDLRQGEVQSRGSGTQPEELAHPASREPRQSQARNGGQDTSGGSEEELAYSNCDEQTEERGDNGEVLKVSQVEGQELSPTLLGGGDTDTGSEETLWPARPGEEQYAWEEPRVTEAQSELGGAVDGSQHRVDRLRLLGNGVVPQTAELAWRTLWKKMN